MLTEKENQSVNLIGFMYMLMEERDQLSLVEQLKERRE